MKNASAVAFAILCVYSAGCGSAEVDVKTLSAPPSAEPPKTPPPPPTAVVAASDNADAVLEGDRIRIAKAIYYDVDKDEIRPESFPVLNAVADILKTHPEIIGLTVEGHTDDQGSTAHNINLSTRRAEAVVRYLSKQGVTTPMLAPGYGTASPLCLDTSEECRAKNRRVEFRVKRKQ